MLHERRQAVVKRDNQMIYPGYQLNPGDMFQVEPDRVLFATGAAKTAPERRATRRVRRKASPDSEEDSLETTSSPAASESAPSPEKPPLSEDSSPPPAPRETLQKLLTQAKTILSTPSSDLTAKRKHSLRAFQQRLKTLTSRPTTLTDSIDAQLLEMASKLNISLPTTSSSSSPSSQDPSLIDGKALAITHAQSKQLKQALEIARENPIDPSKPYATPWRPREFMSAFALVPRYLEVHHRVCSAVYLRHPVARPGLGEVPTPYGIEANGLAFAWYLRRR